MPEQVLCVDSRLLGPAFGFGTDRRLFEVLGEASFVDRHAAEGDETRRQIIPYVLLRGGDDSYFSYWRTRRGGEARLHALRSVGVGGHVNPQDLPGGLPALAVDPEAALAQAARRELREETVGAADAPLSWIGFICDDSAPVARVHFGVVFVADVDPHLTRLSDEGKMDNARFTALDDVLDEIDQYEGWSRLVIEHLAQ